MESWIFGTKRHEKFKQWLENNRISPGVVPLDEEVWIEDWKRIHFTEIKMKHGYKDVARARCVVPLATMPPDDMYGIVKEV